MNQIAILKEMGITTWVSRETPTINAHEVISDTTTSTKRPEMALASFAEIPMRQKELPKVIHEVELAQILEMKWMLVKDPDSASNPLFVKICRAIQDLGVKYQVLELKGNNISHKDIEGDLVLVFGQRPGSILSQENDSIEHLRGILFESQNQLGEDIPVIITYHPREIMANNLLKSALCDDILWSRSIWLESRL